MQRLLLLAAVALVATSANAQKGGDRSPFSSRLSTTTAPALGGGGSNLVIDDGTAENNIGLTNGGGFIWFNQFTPPATDFPLFLQSAEIYFSTDGGFGVGSEYDVYVYSDPDGDPTNGAIYVGGQTGQVVSALDVFNTTTFAGGLGISTPGDVYIMAVNRNPTDAGIFPAAIDQDGSEGRSWVGFYNAGDPPNPPTLPSDDILVIDDAGLPGNWLIRGTYTTEPVTGPNLVVSPSSVDFGEVETAGGPATVTVTLTNTGTEEVEITSIEFEGDAAFTFDDSGVDETLDPLESTTFELEFDPESTGDFTGTVTIESNDPDSPTTVSVTGTGSTEITYTEDGDADQLPDDADDASEEAYTGIEGDIEVSEDVDMFRIYIENPSAFSATTTNAETEIDSRLFLFNEDGSGVYFNDDDPTDFVLTSNLPAGDSNGPTSEGFYYLAISAYAMMAEDGSGENIFCEPASGDSGPGTCSFSDVIPAVDGDAVEAWTDSNAPNGTGTGNYFINLTGLGEGTVASEGAPGSESTLLVGPNPAAGVALVRLTMAAAQTVTVAVFDVTGRQVAVLHDGAVAAGQELALGLNTSALAPGVYVVRAAGTATSLTERVTVVR